MGYLGKKLRLLKYLLGRTRRRGFASLWSGLRNRNVAYQAMELASILPASAHTIVDVGGHHGDFAAALDFHYHPAQLLVVEPNPQLHEPLRNRFSNRPNITVIPACLGESTGETEFHVHEFDAASSRFACQPGHLEKMGFSDRHHTITVPMTTLENLLDEHRRPKVDLLKLDCQGGELPVLRGAGCRLKSVRHIYCEVSFEPVYVGAPLFGEVHEFLLAAGFALVSLHDLSGRDGRVQWADALYRNENPIP